MNGMDSNDTKHKETDVPNKLCQSKSNFPAQTITSGLTKISLYNRGSRMGQVSKTITFYSLSLQITVFYNPFHKRTLPFPRTMLALLPLVLLFQNLTSLSCLPSASINVIITSLYLLQPFSLAWVFSPSYLPPDIFIHIKIFSFCKARDKGLLQFP